MNLEEYRFIICSGCSYDKFAASFKEPFGDTALHSYTSGWRLQKDFVTKHPEYAPILEPCTFLSDNVIMLSLGVGGFDNLWVKESIKFYVDFLLKNNVSPSSIYVLAEFTEFSRVGIPLPEDSPEFSLPESEQNLTEPLGSFTPWEDVPFNMCEILRKLGDIGRLQNYSPIGKVGEKYFIYQNITLDNFKKPEVDSDKKFLTYFTTVRKLIDEKAKELGVKGKIEVGLDYIIETGEYLRSNKITYNFCSMYSLFSYYPTPEDILKYGFFTHRGKLTVYELSPEGGHWSKIARTKSDLNRSGIMLIDVVPELSEKIEKALSFNWTFFEEGNITYGGLDEYTIYNYLTKGYSSPTRLLIDHSLPKPVNHPICMLYPILFKYFAKDCSFIEVNDSYIEAVENFLEVFHKKAKFIPKDPYNAPILTKNVYTETIKEFTEIRNL